MGWSRKRTRCQASGSRSGPKAKAVAKDRVQILIENKSFRQVGSIRLAAIVGYDTSIRQSVRFSNFSLFASRPWGECWPFRLTESFLASNIGGDPSRFGCNYF